MPDEGHALDELLVGADHPIKPPAVIVTPRVGGRERMTFIVNRLRTTQLGLTGGTRQPKHELAHRLPRQRLGLTGGGAEARPPEQPMHVRRRCELGKCGRRHVRRRGRRGRDRQGRSGRPRFQRRVTPAMLVLVRVVLARLVVALGVRIGLVVRVAATPWAAAGSPVRGRLPNCHAASLHSAAGLSAPSRRMS